MSLIIFVDFLPYGFFTHFLRTYTAAYLTESLAHLLFNDNFPLSKNTLSSKKKVFVLYLLYYGVCWCYGFCGSTNRRGYGLGVVCSCMYSICTLQDISTVLCTGIHKYLK